MALVINHRRGKYSSIIFINGSMFYLNENDNTVKSKINRVVNQKPSKHHNVHNIQVVIKRISDELLTLGGIN